MLLPVGSFIDFQNDRRVPLRLLHGDGSVPDPNDVALRQIGGYTARAIHFERVARTCLDPELPVAWTDYGMSECHSGIGELHVLAAAASNGQARTLQDALQCLWLAALCVCRQASDDSSSHARSPVQEHGEHVDD